MRALRRSTQLLVTPLLVLTVLGLTLSSCGGDEGSTKPGAKVDVPDSSFTSETGKAEVAVKVVDNSFEAQYVTVSAGTKITWTNAGRNIHNIVPSNEDAFAKVTTADFGPGKSYQVTFDAPGDYPYYCSVHGTKKSGQTGVIRVVAK